jgi:ubiquitin-protein ligase
MSLKRLNREIMKVFPDKMVELFLPYKLDQFITENTHNIIAELSIGNGYRKILQLTISPEYPFRPPTIWVPNKIANKRYDRWSTDLTGQIIKSFNKTTDSSAFLAWAFSIIEIPMFASGWRNVPFKLPLNCLCCESITCSGNWTPSFTIADILIEYLARKKFALYCSPLWQKRILPIFNNDRWVLPDDIVFSIIQHLNIPGRLKID